MFQPPPKKAQKAFIKFGANYKKYKVKQIKPIANPKTPPITDFLKPCGALKPPNSDIFLATSAINNSSSDINNDCLNANDFKYAK